MTDPHHSPPREKTKTSTGQTSTDDSTYSWYVLFVLSFAGIVSMVDRQIINLLVEPIKQDLGISDTQISLLQGFAIAAFHAFLAIPLARVADLYNRKYVISGGIFLWSIATASCGLVRTFPQLFVARMFVGIGEATLTPAGFSVLSDYFSKRKVSLPIAIFTGSSFLGSGIALVAGGYIIAQVGTSENVVLPLVGELRSWQVVFILASLPAFALLPLMQTVREPKRKGVATSEHGTAEPPQPFSDFVKFMTDNWKAIAPIFIAFPLLAAVQYGLGAWIPTFFIRTHGWTASEIGYVYGGLVVCFGYLGIVMGGWVTNRLLARGIDDANIRVGLYATLAAIPFAALFPIAGDATVSLIVLAPLVFLGTVPFGTGTAALPIIAPNRMRGQVVAAYILIANIVGQGMGPWIVAVLTDYVFQDTEKIGYSLVAMGPTFMALASAVILLSLKHYRLRLRQALADA